MSGALELLLGVATLANVARVRVPSVGNSEGDALVIM